MREFISLSLEIPIQLFFFPFLFHSFDALFVLMLPVLLLATVIYFSLLFLMLSLSPHVDEFVFNTSESCSSSFS